MKNYTFFLVMFASRLFVVHTMEEPPRTDSLAPYSLPSSEGSVPRGGWIMVEQDSSDGTFRCGQKIAPFQVLDLPRQAGPALVQSRLKRRYEKLRLQMDDDHPDTKLLLQVGKALNLLDDEGKLIPYAERGDDEDDLDALDFESTVDELAAQEATRRRRVTRERTWLDSPWTPPLFKWIYFWMFETAD